MEKYRKAIVRDFARLVSCDSVSFRERETADLLTDRLKSLGFTVTEDGAGSLYGGTAGNIYGICKGTLPGKPVLFSAHMDVVEPGTGKQVHTEEGKLLSSGDTVLGADDINGILEILYGIQSILEEGRAHRDIEVLFTIGEEAYGKGASVFDYAPVQAREAYVLDMTGEIGQGAYKAPSIISFQAEVTGKAAHAGFCPEAGIHAIAVAAEIIRELPQGHIGEDTTFNIGTILGGTQNNIVPEKAVFTGEIRSYDHEKAMKLCRDTAGRVEEIAARYGAVGQFTQEVHLKAYATDLDSSCVRRFRETVEKLSLKPELVETFGGSDNNVFAEKGIAGLVLSCGMHNVHSTAEYTTEEELLTGARLVRELILWEA